MQAEPSLDVRMAKIRWQCRRGMLELDILLQRFLDTGLQRLSLQELADLESLLALQDPLLYAYLMNEQQPSLPEWIRLVERIRTAT